MEAAMLKDLTRGAINDIRADNKEKWSIGQRKIVLNWIGRQNQSNARHEKVMDAYCQWNTVSTLILWNFP